MSSLRTGRRMRGLRQRGNRSGKHPDPPEYNATHRTQEKASRDMCRKHWATPNRVRTGVGRYRSSMKKWGLIDTAACECGEPEQKAEHITNRCALHRPPSEAGLFEVGPFTRAWIHTLSCQYHMMIYKRRRSSWSNICDVAVAVFSVSPTLHSLHSVILTLQNIAGNVTNRIRSRQLM